MEFQEIWKILFFQDFPRTFQDSHNFPGFQGFPGRVGTLIFVQQSHEYACVVCVCTVTSFAIVRINISSTSDYFFYFKHALLTQSV